MRRWIAAFLIFAVCATMAHAQTGRRIILLSGSKSWTPLNLSTSLVAWWDAQYLSGLTFNGSNISAWADRKAALVASQATGANQPTWSATARNGKPGLAFASASSQRLTFTPTGFPVGSSAVSIFVGAFGNGAQAFGTAIAYGTAAGNQVFRFRTNAGSLAEYSNGVLNLDGSTWTNIDSAVTITLGSGVNPAVNLYQDGNVGVSGTAATQTLTTANGAIGAVENAGSNFWNGTIQQVVVVSTVLSTCQRQKIEGWESWYDGKAGSNLPSNHPYKNAAPTAGGAC